MPLKQGPSAFSRAAPRWTAVACAAAAVLSSGCSSLNNAGSGIVNAITPYKVEIVQGNFVSREQVALLQPGMSSAQVRELLGSPMLTSVFHADRWDYVFSMNRQGVPPISRKLTVFFKGDLLDRFEGDEMPTEADFVAQIDRRKALGKVPLLEVPEEVLKEFALKNPPAAAAAGVASLPPLPASFPPLEAPGTQTQAWDASTQRAVAAAAALPRPPAPQPAPVVAAAQVPAPAPVPARPAPAPAPAATANLAPAAAPVAVAPVAASAPVAAPAVTQVAAAPAAVTPRAVVAPPASAAPAPAAASASSVASVSVASPAPAVVLAQAPVAPVAAPQPPRAAPAPTPAPVAAPVTAAAVVAPAAAPAPAPAVVRPAPATTVASAAGFSGLDPELGSFLTGWMNDWQSRNSAAFFARYAPDFKGSSATRSEWEALRRPRIETRQSMSLGVLDVRARMVSPTEARVVFRQAFESDAGNEVGTKALFLSRQDGRWIIDREFFTPAQ